MHLLGGTTESEKSARGAFALMSVAACVVCLGVLLSGCSMFGGSSGGSSAGGTSLNDIINNAMPLPPGADTASTVPMSKPDSSDSEDNMDIGRVPISDDNSFTPSGEPLLRPGYILRLAVSVGDKVEVEPFDAQISEKNDILVPLIGKVECDGLTINGLRSRLVTRYGVFFRNPEVSAQFVIRDAYTSPWGRVYIQGRVHREGWVSIPATRRLMLSDAIQEAGGFAQFAKRSNIRVSRRLKDGTIKRFKVDLEEIGRQGKTENDMPLQSGDVVYVFESSI